MPFYPEIKLSYNVTQKYIDKIVRENLPCYIHIATEGPVGYAMRKYCLKNKLSFTTSYHTNFPEFIKESTGLPCWMTAWYFRIFHKPSSCVMVPTISMITRLRKYKFTNKIKIWNRGVDKEMFYPMQRIENKIPIALFVGRMSQEKNIEDFLKLKVPCKKYLVGDGPLKIKLEKQYPEAKFLGYLHGKKLAECYSAADVFVFPSKADTFGLVLLEALACGTPVAAYPVTGPIDVLGKATLVSCLNNDLDIAVETALKLNRKDCQIFAKNFSWSKCTKQFLSNLIIA